MTLEFEPLVSICIPVYNHEMYVKECIESVINQTYKNIELIIIDDGSTDSSTEKVKELLTLCQTRFVRFEFRSRPNKGLCNTLNEAIEWSAGEYFSAIASDDILLIDKTEKQINIFSSPENKNIAYLTGQIHIINEQSNIISTAQHTDTESKIYNFDDVYSGTAKIATPTAIIKLDVLRKIGGYDPYLTIEDFDIWLSITKMGYNIMATNDYFAKYRDHGDNSFKKVKIMHTTIKQIYEKHAPNEIDMKLAIERSNIRAYRLAMQFDRNYAFELLVNKTINPLQRNVISSNIYWLIPYSIRCKLGKIYHVSKSIILFK